jgi:hypothetical protein
MSVREPVADFLAAGGLPNEDDPQGAIERAQELLERVEAEAPVTDEEAQRLATGFGLDDCFGLAWTLLHVIETAPSPLPADYLADSGNWWIKQLHLRAANQRD